MRRLDEAVQREEMPLYEMKSLVEMSKLVLRNIAAKYEQVKEGLGTVMGGRVLEYESKSIFREGVVYAVTGFASFSTSESGSPMIFEMDTKGNMIIQ